MHQQSSTFLPYSVRSGETLSTVDLKCDCFFQISVELPSFHLLVLLCIEPGPLSFLTAFSHSFMSLLKIFLLLFPCQLLFFFFFFPGFSQALFFFPGFWQALISIKHLTKRVLTFISSFSSILCIALACLVSCSSLFSLLHGHAFSILQCFISLCFSLFRN